MPALLLVAALGIGIAWNGAFDLEARLLLHLLVAIAAGLLVFAPAEVLAGSGWAAWLALPAGAGLVGGALATPGALEPDRALVGLGVPVLIGGALAVLGGLYVPSGRPRTSPAGLIRAAAIGLLVVGAIVLLHLALGLDALYGVWPVRSELALGPLVNPNFDAFLAVFALPFVVLELIRRPRPGRPWTWVLVAAVLTGLALIAWSGSRGAIIAVVVVAAVGLGRAWLPRSRLVAPAGVLLGAGAALALVAWLGPHWLEDPTESSLAIRLESWGGALTLLAEHPWLGVGPGNLTPAFPPYQPPFPFVVFDHLHLDVFELALEIGLPATLAVAASLAIVPRAPLRGPLHRSSALLLALVGALTHSAFDFPLHLPGLLLLVALAWGWRLVRWTDERALPPLAGRALFAGVVLLQLGAIGVTAHARVVQALVPAVRTLPPDTDAAATLRALAPWRAEPDLALARRAVLDGDADAARTHALAVVERAPHDASLLLDAAAVLLAARHPDEAATTLDQAMARHAADHRSRALASQVAERRGDRERAVELWAQAVSRWPDERLLPDEVMARALALEPTALWWVDTLEPIGRPMPLYALGVELLDRDDALSGLIALERAAFVDERFANNPMLGVARVRTGQTEAGFAQLDAADAVDRSGRACRLAAELRLERGELDLALDKARCSYGDDPTVPANADILVRATHRALGAEAALDLMPSLAPRGDAPSLAVAASLARAALEVRAVSRCVQLLESRSDRPPWADALLARCRDVE